MAQDAFLQIDIGVFIRIIAVATQGDVSHFNAWVTSYKVLYSTDGASWTSATISGTEVRRTCAKLDWVETGLGGNFRHLTQIQKQSRDEINTR